MTKIIKKHNTDTALKKVNRSIKNHLYFIKSIDEYKDFENNFYKLDKLDKFSIFNEIKYNTNRSFLNYLFDMLVFFNSLLYFNVQYIRLENFKFKIADYYY